MSFDGIFQAGSVAVIGASRDVTKRGYQAIRTLLDEKYEGIIYPVNPKEKSILGLKCYKSVLDIPDDFDLALITTPAHTLKKILEDCGKKKATGAVVIAGGFGEVGQDGRRLEAELLEAANKSGVRIIGPNTSGMISVKNGLNLVGLKNVPKGNIALLTQSGNIALTLITEASLKSRAGFNYYVGVGNEADIKFHEYLEYFTADPDTKVILMYVEGLREGRKFLQQASKTTHEKPIVLFKSGRSVKGSKSAGSHTGALAGISEVSRTAFKRAGIITVDNSDEMFPIAETLASQPLITENGIAILADGGGHATIAADYLTELGVKIAELDERTREKLAAILPSNASLANPVDVAGGTDQNPSVFADCAKILLDDRNVHGLLIVGLFGGYGIRFAEKLSFMEEDAAHRMGKLVRQSKKPIIVHSLYNFAKPHSLDLLRYYGIPVHDSLEISCKCVEALTRYGSYRREHQKKSSFEFHWGAKAHKEGQEIIDKAIAEGRNSLLENEAKDLLRLHDVSVSVDRLAGSEDEAVKIAEELGYNVAMKIVSPDILHKSDAGGVMLKLNDEKQVRRAFRTIIKNAREYKPDADIKGCLVSEMSEEGVEIIIGTKMDDQFGPIVMFGIGGILVEVMKDVSFRVLPVSHYWATSMIEEIKSKAILNGMRGRPACDKKAIAKLIKKVSEITESYPIIYEMDLNPVIVHENGLKVVDARIILSKENIEKKKKLSLALTN
jgi:acetate---CoA ligase (ADP-forming)